MPTMTIGQQEIIERIIRRMPHPEWIRDLDTTSESTAVRFAWRGDEFRVSQSFFVEQVKGRMLASNNTAAFLESLLKMEIA